MVIVAVTVPPGAIPGQSISFEHSDGRKVSLVIPAGVVAGQALQVNIPDAPPCDEVDRLSRSASASKKARGVAVSADPDPAEGGAGASPAHPPAEETSDAARSSPPSAHPPALAAEQQAGGNGELQESEMALLEMPQAGAVAETSAALARGGPCRLLPEHRRFVRRLRCSAAHASRGLHEPPPPHASG